MPRSPRKPARARKSKARASKGQALTTVNRSLQPFPNRYVCKLKYATTVVTDALGSYIFNLNSLFDPDRTGGGHQPYGFDNLALLYNRYRCIATGWRIQNPMAANALPVTTGCIASNDASVAWTNTGVMLENPRAKYVTQNPGAASVTLSGKISLPKLMGRTKSQYMADDNYQSPVVGSPNELGLLYIQTFAATNGNTTAGQALQVILEYTVEFFDSKHVVQS